MLRSSSTPNPNTPPWRFCRIPSSLKLVLPNTMHNTNFARCRQMMALIFGCFNKTMPHFHRFSFSSSGIHSSLPLVLSTLTRWLARIARPREHALGRFHLILPFMSSRFATAWAVRVRRHLSPVSLVSQGPIALGNHTQNLDLVAIPARSAKLKYVSYRRVR